MFAAADDVYDEADFENFKLNANRYGYRAEFTYESDVAFANVSGVRLAIRSPRNEVADLLCPILYPLENADGSPDWNATYCLATMVAQLLNMGFSSDALAQCVGSLPRMVLTLPRGITRSHVTPTEAAPIAVYYLTGPGEYLKVVDGDNGYTEPHSNDEMIADRAGVP